MRTNAIIRIVLFSIAIFLLLGILGLGLGVTAFMADFTGEGTGKNTLTGASESIRIPDSGDAETYTCTADPGVIRELEIEWAAGTITIRPSADADTILVSETQLSQEKYQMVCKQSGDALSIQFCRDSIHFPSLGITADISKDLLILVPEGWVCRSLEIDAASANVELQDLQIEELDFDGASGTCDMDNCTVGTMDLDAASGDVRFCGSLDTLDFDGASASCTLVLTNCPRHIDLDGMSGDLDLTLPEGCGFTVEMNAMSSEFSSEFDTKTVNGCHAYGDGSCRISIDAMSGDVILRKGGEARHDSHHS